MNVKKIVFGAIALFMMVSCGKKSGGMPGMGSDEAIRKYPTQVLSPQDALLESVYPVTIKGEEDIEIRPRIDGFIEEIYVDEGSIVRKGQVLFRINSPMADQALTTAEAGLNSVMAQVNTARLNVERIKPLADKGIVSSIQLETYQNAYNAALAAKAQSEAVLKNARATKSWTSVVSPVNGVVGTIPFRQGSLVNSGNILTTVANITNVYANFSLNEKDLMSFLNNFEGKTQSEKIKNIPPLTLILADGSTYPEKGKIETISGLINVNTGSANLRAEFPNPNGILRSGTSGKIIIPRTLKDVYIIPQVATFSQQDKTLVYTVQGDSVLQKVISVVALPGGKDYAVMQGLTNGERIVSGQIATLKNGAKIIVE